MKKLIVIILIVLLVIVVFIAISPFLMAIEENRVMTEKYGKDSGIDRNGNRCAMSQLNVFAYGGGGLCDYSKPVINLDGSLP